ncbi:MAG: tetratricopeptide repeat protein [Caulobacterales bacterium]|nr:tetratricopeptide repeat protein [Caulobacterales bacterium]
MIPSELAALQEQALQLHADGKLDEAEILYQRILSLEPLNFTATHCLGVIESQRFHYEAAVERIGEALRLNPRSAMAHLNLGIALGGLGRYQEALTHYQLSLVLNPKFPDTYMNRAIALHRLGRHEESLASYDKCLSIKPDFALAHSNKVFVLDYVPGFGFEEHQAERRRFYEAQAKRFEQPPPIHGNDRNPSRRLVLGYVSADFRRHSAASCFGPVLLRHDRAAFKVVCYSGTVAEDDWTQRFREAADLWRPTAGLSDDELAARIRADGIDILIDLSAHSEGNRLLVFARKPAPIQVTGWGHGGGTGLPMIDYLFTDPVHIPAWARPLFAEKAYDLPCNITFEPPGYAPAVADLPARRQGFVTFGSLNRFVKITTELLDLWAGILAEVPGSRLLLKDAALEDPSLQAQLRDHFGGRGIGPERVLLRGFSDHEAHLAAYNEVDIVLDPFPQNGGITTWEALWMGAPVVAIPGNKPSSRISASILQALGLGEWVAGDEAGYRELAVRRAADLNGLARFREGIRARIEASPAGNPQTYTRAVEEGYRAMWIQWLAR